ncbi:MAG: TolC family protein, partial [Bacteroidota bacterium]
CRALPLILILFGSVQINAQGKPFSFSDYMNAALKNHPLLSSAEQAKASALYGSEAVQQGYAPQIGVASHFIAAPGYDEAVTNGGEFGAQITASYLLYDGGARSYEIQRAGVGVDQGTLNQDRTRADIILSVSTAFAAAAKEKRELEVVEQDYEQLRDYLQLVKQLHASGQGDEADVLKTTVELNNVLIDVDARKTTCKNSLMSLAQAAGLPTADVTDVDTSLQLPSYDTTFSGTQNIDLTSQSLVLKQAELDAQIAGAKLRPNISVGADAGALTSLPNLQPGLANVFGASLGLSVTVPLFTFGSLENTYHAAEANARSIALQNDYARSSLEHDFNTTRNNVERAKSEIAALQGNLLVAEQNLLLSKARYAGGSGLSLEVLDAIRMVNQIKLAFEEARFQMETGIFRLSRLNYSGAHQE